LSATGRFHCLGKLATNESFSIGFDARADRKLDLFWFHSPNVYASPNGFFRSTFYGTLELRDVPDVSDADGSVRWKDLPTAERFITDLSVIASRYVPTVDVLSLFAAEPAPGADPSLGVATFSHELYPEPKEAVFRFNPPQAIAESKQLLPKLRWKSFANSFPGRFSGRVRPGRGRGFPFSGVFFPKQRIAEGFFPRFGNSGIVRLGIKPN